MAGLWMYSATWALTRSPFQYPYLSSKRLFLQRCRTFPPSFLAFPARTYRTFGGETEAIRRRTETTNSAKIRVKLPSWALLKLSTTLSLSHLFHKTLYTKWIESFSQVPSATWKLRNPRRPRRAAYLAYLLLRTEFTKTCLRNILFSILL